MRPLLLLLAVLSFGPSRAAAQATPPPEPASRRVLVDDVPQGTNWVADGRTKKYYRVGCPITINIPQADRLYYRSETYLQSAGFTKSAECITSNSVTSSPAPSAQPSPSAEPSPITTTDSSSAASSITTAQQKNPRKGFWFNVGLGYGSLGCQDCSGRTGALSGGLALGGALSQKVMLGVGTNGWAKSENGVTLTVATLTGVIRFYPSSTGGFFLLGGLGVGTIHAGVSGVASGTETGFGALLGLGYDIRVGKNVSLTPFWNGFATTTTNSDANVGQIGLGLTTH